MAQELKVRITNYIKIEEKLIILGCRFLEELNVTDTYFSQPEGKVLKLTEDETGSFLVELQAKDGKFSILKNEKLENAEKTKNEMGKKFGIKCVLKKKRRFFEGEKFGLGNFNTNLIEGLGEFLILEGEQPDARIVTEILGIREPEYITMSFDRLKENH